MTITTVVPRESALDPAKFRDPGVTATGERRAEVSLQALETLWFNTGTLCNLTCVNCYIESSPTNDRLVHITAAEVQTFLDEITRGAWPTEQIGLTGGEPFMNPEIIAIMDACLSRGFKLLVLTNGMRPMMRLAAPLIELKNRFGNRLTVRVSLDHHTKAVHECERGPHSWEPALAGLAWLSDNGFCAHVAGRSFWPEETASGRSAGYARLFAERGIRVDANDVAALVVFPEMDETLDVAEITESCWGILDVDPGQVMCATSRMVVKRRGAARPVILPCTLLPSDSRFELGETLADASTSVKLNHPHCARFCVLGGASCSPAPHHSGAPATDEGWGAMPLDKRRHQNDIGG